MDETAKKTRPHYSNELLLICAGACLLLSQYVAVREAGSTFFSTELIVIMVVVTSLIGPSIAYQIADRVSDNFIKCWAFSSLILQLLLPTGLRCLIGTLPKLDLWAMLCLFLVFSLLLSGTFAIYLPRLAKSNLPFRKLYFLELSGGFFGLLLLLTAHNWNLFLCCFWLLAACVIHFGFNNKKLSALAFSLWLLASWSYSSLDQIAAARFFCNTQQISDPWIMETRYSPYQRIDVVQDKNHQRSLFLDGVVYYCSGINTLSCFDVLMSYVPGKLLHKKGGRALVVGSGSFSSAAFLCHQGYDVTVCELDADVAEMGFLWFKPVHGLKPSDFHLVIGDARKFLSDSKEKWDIIVMDVPAPYHVQTALLHSTKFYTQLSQHLLPGGIASISLCSRTIDNNIGNQIVASASGVFRDLMAVQSGSCRLITLYVSNGELPFKSQDVLTAWKDPRGFTQTYSREDILKASSASKPISSDNLAVVLQMSLGSLHL